MRISFYNFFHAGGIGRYTADLLGALARHEDLDIELMCTPQFRWQAIEGVEVWPGLFPITHSMPNLRRARFLLGNWISPRRALRRVNGRKADIIHFSEFNHLTYPFWRRRLKRTGAKVVVSVHDVARQKAILHRGWEDRNLIAFYRAADALLVHSPQQVKSLQAFAGVWADRIHLVPHGPVDYGPCKSSRQDLHRAYGVPESASVGLFFGQLRDEKNLEGLLEALSLTNRRVYLIVAGQAGSRHRSGAYYEALARQFGIADRVQFRWGHVPDAEVPRLFTVADWVALPYRRSFTSQSGVLNVAMQYERPVLVGTAPALAEAARSEDIGEAVRGESPEYLAGALERLLDRLEKPAAFDFAGYRARNSWAENARITADIYRSLVHDQAARGVKSGAGV